MKNIILSIVIGLLVVILGITSYLSFKYYQDNNNLKLELTQLSVEKKSLNDDLTKTREDLDNLTKRIDELTKLPETYIKVIMPNGGETVCLNNNTTIKWESKGIDRIGIRIIKQIVDGTNYYNISEFQSISANNGSVLWKVKNIPVGDNYKVEITSIDADKTKIVATSEKVFAISYCQ